MHGGRVSVSTKLRAEIEAEAGGPKLLALRGTVMAFVNNGDARNRHQDETRLSEADECLEEIEARFHGAEVLKELDDPRLTHVVIIGEDHMKEEGGNDSSCEKGKKQKIEGGGK